MRIGKSRRLELLFGPVACAIELRRTCEPWPDTIGEIRQVSFQHRLVFFDLFDDFRIHLGDRVGFRR